MKTALFAFIFLIGLTAHAVSLQGALPDGWKQVSQDVSGKVYRLEKSKRDEMVIVQSIPAQNKDAQMLDSLTAPKLTSVRRSIFETVGLYEYVVHDVRRLSPLVKGSASTQILIEASYNDYAGQTVQMIERQYLIAEKLYTVSYRMNAKSIDDYDRIRILLDKFKPHVEQQPKPTRGVASEMSYSQEVMTSGKSDKLPVASKPKTYEEPQMTKAQFDERCKAVPEEQRKNFGDPGFDVSLKGAMIGSKSCLMGVGEWAWDFAKGIWSAAASGARMIYDGDYRSEMASTAGTLVAEAYRAPLEFGGRVLTTLFQAANQYTDNFFTCLNGQAQIEATCKLLSNAIPIGLVIKLMMRTALTAEEIAQISNAAKNLRDPILENAKLRGEKAYLVKAADGDDAISKAARSLEKRDIDVYAQDKLPGKAKSVNGYSGIVEERPFVAIKKSALADPEMNAGTVGHEATHAVNKKRALEGQELGRARTISFVSEIDKKLNNGMSSYAKRMRVDEVHARAVQSGINVNLAEKAIAEGRFADARELLKKAEANIKQANIMKNSGNAYFELAQTELANGNFFNRINYNRKTGQIDIRAVDHTVEQTERLKKLYAKDPEAARLQDSKLPGVQVKLNVSKNLTEQQAIREVENLIYRGRQELNRFNTALNKNNRRLEQLKLELGSEP